MLLLEEPRKTKSTSSNKRVRAKKDRVEKKPRVFNYGKFHAVGMKIKPKYLNLGLVFAVVAVAVFGVMMVYSSSHYVAGIFYDNPWHYFTR